MNKIYLFLTLIILSNSIFSQSIAKPIGCFAGTNGTYAINHPEARGVYLMERWSAIELEPGVFDFTALDNKIAEVTSQGVKYSLGIPAGALGSPQWLIDSLGADYFSFMYRGSMQRLPKWWDATVKSRLEILINKLGSRYSNDPLLSHIYVSQMSTNGVEGHLNGVDISAFTAAGYTDSIWIKEAIQTVDLFSLAFPEKPIVFEVHEIANDTLVPSTIINHFYNDSAYCNRIGLAMWWISGKTSYQPDLLTYIQNFKGDKYAQVIGRSDELDRFKDSIYSNVFTQAKTLGIRYIEPWPYEFQHNTNDSLFQDFNIWADANFSPTDTCSYLTTTTNPTLLNNELVIYPNPTNGSLNIKIDFPYKELKITIFNLRGQKILTANNRTELEISHFPKGLYFIKLKIDNEIIDKKIIKVE